MEIQLDADERQGRSMPSTEEVRDLPDDRRITTLADGVFAIVMTLLVLGIDVPEVPEEEIADRLVGEVLWLWPLIATYVVSFLYLGIYWIGHHSQYHYMRVVNTNALWLNIVFLMFVCLIPFTTGLVGTYPRQEIALSLYGANLIAISLASLAHWRYASRAGLLEAEAGTREMRKATRRLLIGAALFALAIALAFVHTPWSLAVFLLVPVLHILPGPIHVDWTR
jgi:uncharacterized membrane protein